jgi:hypothetical protein
MSSGAILPIHALLLIAAFRIPWVRFTELDVFGSIPQLVRKCSRLRNLNGRCILSEGTSLFFEGSSRTPAKTGQLLILS